MTIGDKLDRAMKLRGIRSQAELARRSGVPQPTINRTLKDVSEPELATLRKLADALGVDVLSLMEDGAESAPATAAKPVAEQDAMVAKYVRRLTTLLTGRSEDEITRIVRALELLMPAKDSEASKTPRTSRKLSFSGDVTPDEVSFSRSPRRKSGTHE